MGKAVLHGAYIDETAAGIADRSLSARLAPEEEQAGVLLFRIFCFFLFRIDIKKDLIAGGSLFSQIIYDLHGLIRIDIVVPGENALHIFQSQII